MQRGERPPSDEAPHSPSHTADTAPLHQRDSN